MCFKLQGIDICSVDLQLEEAPVMEAWRYCFTKTPHLTRIAMNTQMQAHPSAATLQRSPSTMINRFETSPSLIGCKSIFVRLRCLQVRDYIIINKIKQIDANLIL